MKFKSKTYNIKLATDRTSLNEPFIKFYDCGEYRTLVDIALKYGISLTQLYERVLELPCNGTIDSFNVSEFDLTRKSLNNSFGIDLRFKIFRHDYDCDSLSSCRNINFYYFDENQVIQKCDAVDATLMGLINGKTYLDFNKIYQFDNFEVMMNKIPVCDFRNYLKQMQFDGKIDIINTNTNNDQNKFTLQNELEKALIKIDKFNWVNNIPNGSDIICSAIKSSLQKLEPGMKAKNLWYFINLELNKSKQYIQKDYLLSIKDDDLDMNMYKFINSINIDIYNDIEIDSENTFDFIEVSVETPKSFQQKREFLLKFKEEFLNIIIDKIEDIRNSNKFKNYNISTNALKLTKMAIRNNNEIITTFKLS